MIRDDLDRAIGEALAARITPARVDRVLSDVAREMGISRQEAIGRVVAGMMRPAAPPRPVPCLVGRRSVISQAVVAEIIRLYEASHTTTEIARAVGVARSTAAKYIKIHRENAARRHPPAPWGGEEGAIV